MGYTSNITIEQLREARLVAVKFHGNQKYGDHPYEVHLDHVVGVLRRFGVEDTDLLAAGYLHDVVEDTEATTKIVELFTNERVAELVDAISDGEGRNRKERKERPYRLIPTVEDAIILKLSDRIANLENGHANESSLVGMYRKEQPYFEERLYDKERVMKGKDPRLTRMWKYCRMLAA